MVLEKMDQIKLEHLTRIRIRIRLFVQQNKQEIHMNKIAIEPDKQGTAVH